MPPDLTKIQECELAIIRGDGYGGTIHELTPFTVPEDGWILQFSCSAVSTFVSKIDGLKLFTPRQFCFFRLDNEGNYAPVVIDSLNCPYQVKKGQIISIDKYQGLLATIAFAPCISV